MACQTHRGARVAGQAPAAPLPAPRRGAPGCCSAPGPRRPLHGLRAVTADVAERAAAAHAEERLHARANGNGLANGNGKSNGLAYSTANGLANGRTMGLADGRNRTGAEPVSQQQQPEAPAPPAGRPASATPAAAEPEQPQQHAGPPDDPDGQEPPAFDGVEEVEKMSAKIMSAAVVQRQRVPRGMFSAFARSLRRLHRRERVWTGPTVVLALHRLAVARWGCGWAPGDARAAFLVLLGRVGRASAGMDPRQLARTVWAVASFARAEDWELPPFVPPEQRSGEAAAAYGHALSGGGPDAGAGGSGREAAQEAGGSSGGGAGPVAAPASAEQGAAQASAAAAASGSSPPHGPQLGQAASERLSSHRRAGRLQAAAPPREARSARRRRPQLPQRAHDNLGELAAVWLAKLERCDAQSLCMLLEAFARLGCSPLGGRLFALSQARARPLLEGFGGNEVVSFLWAFAESQEPLGAEALDAIARRGVALVEGGELQAAQIAAVVQALGRMGRDPLGGAFVDAMLGCLTQRRPPERACKHLRCMTPEALASVWVGLAALRHVPGEFAEAWAAHCARCARKLGAREVLAVEQACAVLGLDPLHGRLLRTLRREREARERLARPPPPVRRRPRRLPVPAEPPPQDWRGSERETGA